MRELRRKDRALPEELAELVLADGEYGVLATAGKEYPYAVPLNYVYKNGAIYFHSALEGQKLDLLKENPRVSFCVVGAAKILPQKFSTAYKSVIAFGTAELVEGEEKRQALLELINKYAYEFQKAGQNYVERDADKCIVVKITVEHLTGKGRSE